MDVSCRSPSLLKHALRFEELMHKNKRLEANSTTLCSQAGQQDGCRSMIMRLQQPSFLLFAGGAGGRGA